MAKNEHRTYNKNSNTTPQISIQAKEQILRILYNTISFSKKLDLILKTSSGFTCPMYCRKFHT